MKTPKDPLLCVACQQRPPAGYNGYYYINRCDPCYESFRVRREEKRVARARAFRAKMDGLGAD